MFFFFNHNKELNRVMYLRASWTVPPKWCRSGITVGTAASKEGIIGRVVVITAIIASADSFVSLRS